MTRTIIALAAPSKRLTEVEPFEGVPMPEVIRRPGGRSPVVVTTPNPEADPDLAAMSPSPRVVTSQDVIIGAQARQRAGLAPLAVLHPEPVRESAHIDGGIASGGTSSTFLGRRPKSRKR